MCYTAVLLVKPYPMAVGFSRDTACGFITVSHSLQKSILSHFQVLNCLEEKAQLV